MESDYSDFESHSSYSSFTESSEYYSTSSMFSTPSRAGLSNNNSFTVDAIKGQVKRDVKERYVGQKIDVVQFVKNVWGLKQEVIDAITIAASEGKLSLPEEPLLRYQNSKEEKYRYKPFLEIGKALVEKTRAILSTADESCNILFENQGTLILKSPYSERKPDAVAICATNRKDTKDMTWQDVIIPLEFKVHKRGSRLIEEEFKVHRHSSNTRLTNASFPIQSMPLLPAVGCDKAENAQARGSLATHLDSNGASSYPKKPASHTSSHHSRPRSSRVDPNVKLDEMPVQSSNRSRKRKTDDEFDLSSPKRCTPSSHITNDQLQLARYALECMAASSRYYVTGVFIDKSNLSLWYYDRALVASTTPFDFEKNPGMLALVLYAIDTCDLRHAGFNQFIIPPTDPRPLTLKELFDSTPSMMQSENDEFIFPFNDKMKRFRIDGKPLHANRGLVGRGTFVFSVVEIGEDGASETLYAVKTMWRQTKRQKEADLINKLREAIPEMSHHLPQIVAFANFNAGELGLPRQILGFIYPSDWERELHMIVMKRYKGLWYAKDVDEFKDIFVNCVEFHYAAFKRGRVLHRDLSANNLMCDDTPKGRVGIVGDWDLSSLIDDQGEVIVSHTQHRTGTLPFMSKQLLTERPPLHKYWHDLESLLYILLWAAVHFDLKTHRQLPIHMRFREWNSDSLFQACKEKDAFLSNNKNVDGYLNIVQPELKDLRGWILALRKLIGSVYEDVNRAGIPGEDPVTGDWVTSEPDGLFEERITFESFMSAIGRMPHYAHK